MGKGAIICLHLGIIGTMTLRLACIERRLGAMGASICDLFNLIVARAVQNLLELLDTFRSKYHGYRAEN
jgi:hypothetical protein